ncbi:MAG: hypothetical protein R2706_06450 [Acidimicrobiales bacterium]
MDVPSERSIRALLEAADNLASTIPAGPHVYWKYRLVCDACDSTWTVVYFMTLDGPPETAVPEGHPGLFHPSHVHDFSAGTAGGGQRRNRHF